jgi:hypothetical protein
VEKFGGNVAERQRTAVANAAKRLGRVASRKQDVFGRRRTRKPSSGRQVIGMKVRVDDVDNAQAGRLGNGQIGVDPADGSTTAQQALPPQPNRYDMATGSLCRNERRIMMLLLAAVVSFDIRARERS